MNFQASSERIAGLKNAKAFQALATSKKKDQQAKAREEAEGKREQDRILAMLASMPKDLFKDRPPFESALAAATRKAGLKLATPTKKAILSAPIGKGRDRRDLQR